MSKQDDDLYDALALAILEGKLEPPQKKKFEVELRDARTGEKLGITNRQYKHYVLAMGTKDPAIIINACREVRERRLELRPTTKFKCIKPT